jgi:DNA-binding MarR family transcriptional regulator
LAGKAFWWGEKAGGGFWRELQAEFASYYDIVIRYILKVPGMANDKINVRPRDQLGVVSAAGYRQLAEFRYRIRRFLHFSEEAARSHGIEPQQHQLLLAVKGLPEGTRPTVTELAQRLCLRHHSTVELVDRLVERGAVSRQHNELDRREVFIVLTPHGEELLQQLSALLWEELRVNGPALSEALSNVLAHSPGPGRGKHGSASAR